jgi:hypothetical protein
MTIVNFPLGTRHRSARFASFHPARFGKAAPAPRCSTATVDSEASFTQVVRRTSRSA